MAMPPPIVPAPMTPARRIGRGSRSLGMPGILARFALGEEHVPLCPATRAVATLDEALALQALSASSFERVQAA